MRANRHIEVLKSKRNKHAVFSMVVAVVMLIAFYQLPQFQDFNFINLSPCIFYLCYLLILPQKDKERTTEKEQTPLKYFIHDGALLHH